MGIIEVILGFGPILFSGAIAGSLASYFAPTIIKKLKANFHHKRIDELYETYQHHPEQLAKKSPEVLKFFKDEKWKQCECSCCKWLRVHDSRYNKKKIEKVA